MAITLQGMAPLLQVYDMPRALHFYRDLLGFAVEQSSGEGDAVDWVLLRLQGMELMLNTMYESDQRPAQPDVQRTAAHGDTMLYFGCPDVEAAYITLVEKGWQLQPPHITGYGWKGLAITDPNGYQLFLHWPQSNA
jgi:glyoxylase I family protein